MVMHVERGSMRDKSREVSYFSQYYDCHVMVFTVVPITDCPLIFECSLLNSFTHHRKDISPIFKNETPSGLKTTYPIIFGIWYGIWCTALHLLQSIDIFMDNAPAGAGRGGAGEKVLPYRVPHTAIVICAKVRRGHGKHAKTA